MLDIWISSASVLRWGTCLQRGAQASSAYAPWMRAGTAPAFGAAAAANSGAAGLVTGAGAAALQGELGSARNPVYMMQV